MTISETIQLDLDPRVRQPDLTRSASRNPLTRSNDNNLLLLVL